MPQALLKSKVKLVKNTLAVIVVNASHLVVTDIGKLPTRVLESVFQFLKSENISKWFSNEMKSAPNDSSCVIWIMAKASSSLSIKIEIVP